MWRQTTLAALEDMFEAQKNNLLLWTPVLLAFGISIYFVLQAEPSWMMGFIPFGLAVCTVLAVKERIKIIALGLCIMALGFLAGQARTAFVATPMLSKDVGPAMVTGVVKSIDPLDGESHVRLIIEPLEIEDLEQEKLPKKIRLTLREGNHVSVGDTIEGLAKMHAPSSAVIPGRFDFRQYLYFQSIGAIGFFYKDVQVLEQPQRFHFDDYIQSLRNTIGQRIKQHLGPETAPIAIALMIGQQTAISDEDKEIMRIAGLSHILAVSGMNVVLFAGSIFFFVRLLLVLIPHIGVIWPVKKISAVAAIIGVFVFMALAGGSLPTIRAVIMSTIVFGAILIDRHPFSMRLMAFAAFTVLLFAPESIFSASFQMSFAAVAALIFAYEKTEAYWRTIYHQAGMFKRIALYFIGMSFTTIVATIATAPFSLYNFHQLSTYGLLGNLLALPVVGSVIMPFIMLAMVLMPLGLEFIPLYIANLGIIIVKEIAQVISELPGAMIYFGLWPGYALALIVFGALCLMLNEGKAKLIGLPFFMIALWGISNYQEPAVLISPDIKLVGVHYDDHFYISSKTSNRFLRESWGEALAIIEERIQKFPKEGTLGPITCGEYGCNIKTSGKMISYINNRAALSEACANADLVLAAFPAKNCSAPMIDYFDGRYNGVHALWIKDSVINIKSAKELTGDRPWSQ